MAERGRRTMQFGPLKPVGLEDPRTGLRPAAVVQLRTENIHRTCYNMVGFQTKLTYPEQKRVFRLIPGLEQAEFLRYADKRAAPERLLCEHSAGRHGSGYTG